jgi:hypothetical protein
MIWSRAAVILFVVTSFWTQVRLGCIYTATGKRGHDTHNEYR